VKYIEPEEGVTMKDVRSYLCVAVAFGVAVAADAAWGANNLIFNVPDWQQPDYYASVGTPGLVVGDYPDWCAPTSGAMLLGYWEDVRGYSGMTDGMIGTAGSPIFPASPGTWQQGLWHDATIEIAWHMDTGSFGPFPPPGGPYPPLVGKTSATMITPGIVAYVVSPWVDVVTGITKTSYISPQVGTDTSFTTTLPVAWDHLKGEIDAGRPVLATFNHWINTQYVTNQTVNFGGTDVTVEKYNTWDFNVPEHTVCAVGYLDLVPGVNGDEWIIAQDNWQTTGQYAAVPLDSQWAQNDYLYNVVPEPSTLVLLTIAGISLLAYTWHRRKQISV
jgi:hypothetical protein